MSLTAKNAKKYFGEVATGYVAKRSDKDKWINEDKLVHQFLSRLRSDALVLDCPVGTGRFIPHYRNLGIDWCGFDISEDMLREARRIADLDDHFRLRKGSIFEIPFGDNHFDATLCIRIVNLIDPPDMQRALKELQRVTKGSIIFNVRVRHPETKYRNPQRIEDIEAALISDFFIASNVQIHEHDFRMITLKRRGANEMD